MAVLGFLFFNIMLFQRLSPAPASVDQLCLITKTRTLCAVHDDGLESLRAQNRSATVSGEVIVVVGEHGGAIHVLPGGTDAEHFRFPVSHDFAQTIFGSAGAEAPEIRGIAQLSIAFVDVKIDRLPRRTGNYNTVITCRL